jgi:hypothetical protein
MRHRMARRQGCARCQLSLWFCSWCLSQRPPAGADSCSLFNLHMNGPPPLTLCVAKTCALSFAWRTNTTGCKFVASSDQDDFPLQLLAGFRCCRLFSSMQTAALPDKLKLAKLKPVWLDHLGRSELLDGDAIFLHRLSQDLTSGVSCRAQACGWFILKKQAACSTALQRSQQPTQKYFAQSS